MARVNARFRLLVRELVNRRSAAINNVMRDAAGNPHVEPAR